MGVLDQSIDKILNIIQQKPKAIVEEHQSERIKLKSVEEAYQDDYYEEEEIVSSKYKYPQDVYQSKQVSD